MAAASVVAMGKLRARVDNLCFLLEWFEAAELLDDAYFQAGL